MFQPPRISLPALLPLLFLAGILVTPATMLAQGGPVFNPATGHWYQSVAPANGISWTAARAEAQGLVHQSQPGYLATLNSAEELEFLAATFPQAVTGGYLLGGFQDAGNAEPDGGWQWVTGEPWENPAWDAEQPDDFSGGSGLAFQNGGFLRDVTLAIPVTGYLVEFGTSAPPIRPITFEHRKLAPLAAPGDVAAYDFDDDGKPDLAANSNQDVALLYGNGDGTFSGPHYLGLSTSQYYEQTLGADLDRDGRTDVVTVSGDSIYTYRNLGGRTFAAPSRYVAVGRSFGLHATDLTGDLLPELLVCDHDANRLGILINAGNGTFGAPSYQPTGSLPGRIVSADWNRDGRMDVAITNVVGGTISLFSGNGNGSIAPRGTVSTGGAYPVQLVTTDFNRDGHLDLLTANTFSDTLSVMYGNGNGTFNSGVTFPANSNPNIMAAVDLDGDGDSDLAAPNGGTHFFTFFRNAAGLPGSPLEVSAGGKNARTMASADFNRDGRPDLAVGCEASNAISVFLNTTPFPAPVAPISLEATPESATRIDLTWVDLSTSEAAFILERRGEFGNFAQIAVVPAAPSNGTLVSYSDSAGLQPGNTYYYRVRASSSLGESAFSNVATAATLPIPPNAPTNLVATPLSHSLIQLTWQDNSANETAFTVERRTGGGAYIVQMVLAADVTSFLDVDVTALTTYIYRVRADNSSGPSSHTNEAMVTTPSRPTDAPTDLGAAAVSSSVIRVAWRDRSVNETEFRIERKPAGGVFAQIAIRGPRAGADGFTAYDDNNGLLANSTYVYRVRAAGPQGVSAYSNEGSATTIPQPPAAPSNLSATLTAPTTIELAWTDNSGNETGFSVERRTGSVGAFTFIGGTDADTPTFPDPGLAPDTLYTYRVRSVGSSGSSAYSNEATSGTTPTAPSGLTAQGGVGQVTLQWADNSQSESGFKIERKNGATFVLVSTTSAGAVSYTNTGLLPNTSYTFRVRAANPGGDSAPSNEALALTIPAAPTSLLISTLNASQLALSWVDSNPTPPAAKVERSLSMGGPFTEIGTAAVGSVVYQDNSLSAATTYYYRVRSSNFVGLSGYSNVAQGTTTPAAPAAPSLLTGSALTSRKVSLAWQDNSSNETGFEVWRLSPGSPGYQFLSFTNAGHTSFLDTTVTGSTTYSYRVRATNGGGPSVFSNPAQVNTPVDIPSAPEGVMVVGTSHTLIRVQWTDTSDNETSFTLERKTSGGSFVTAANVGANATQYFDGGLSEATIYTYRIRASNGNGNSQFSSEASGATLPRAPTSLTATPGSQRVDLQWSDQSSGESGYVIERKVNAGGGFSLLASVAQNATTYGDTTVLSGSTYTYRVRATGSGTASEYSNEASAAPLATTPLAKLVVSPKRVNFGNVRVGVLKRKTIKLTNKGKEALTVTVPDVGAPFAVTSGGGTAVLAPRGSRTVTVTYTPVAAGSAAATLNLSSTDPRALLVPVELAGKGR